ncbi:MAG: transglycosylase domain-containing protein [Saprospiraceae bacterium]|nr:transglycosylase domain-containing protein [Saprospiraceae bacterium]
MLGTSGLVAGACLLVGGLLILVKMGYFGALPTYAELTNIQNSQASEIYDFRGISIGRYYIENRVNADSSELPKHLREALIATEDARFFEHSGIDFRSLGRVFFRSILLSDESSGGGSTISQQLAKNLYPRRDYAFIGIVINKMREMLIAHRLEKVYSKEHILRLYLNTVPFEGNAFGVKIAAQRFFNTSLDKLKLEDAAVLVGMLKGTSYYNPVNYPDRAKTRRNTVLNQMVKAGYLSADSAQLLGEVDIKLDYQPESHNLGLATYFREHLRQELDRELKDLKKPDGSAYNLYTDGLKIHTTLDATMQRYAEQSMYSHLKHLQKIFLEEWNGQEPWMTNSLKNDLVRKSERYQRSKEQGLSDKAIEEAFNTAVPMQIFDWDQGQKEVELTPWDSIRYYLSLLQAGMLAVEPQSGAVKVWVGGIDHRYIQFDHVKSRRHIGSVMKPIVYATALKNGMSPCEYYENSLVQYAEYNDWEPHNSDGAYGGYYSMEGALSHSVNTVTVDIALETGLEPIRELAGGLGIDSDIPLEPSLALGAFDASLWDMIGAYATFANEGTHPKVYFLEKVVTADGTVLVDHSKMEKDLSSPLTTEEAAIVNHFLQSVVDSGTARRLRYEYNIAGPIAGKTGTTQDQSDGWFIGYTPSLVAGVWVGAELPVVHFRTTHNGQGANTALPIWGKFMQRIKANKRTAKYLGGQFSPPDDSTLFELDCPHYLPEMPEIFDSIIDLAELLKFSQNVADIDSANLTDIMQRAPRRRSEALSEYSERIRERNEKILEKRERRKKRKAFFDKLFGRKN